jgi:hypothetical protein
VIQRVCAFVHSLDDVVLGFETLEEYLQHNRTFYFGSVFGVTLLRFRMYNWKSV